MKLSMWMILKRLEKYRPKYDIKDGEASISGVRFFPGEATEYESQYVYLHLDNHAIFESRASEEAALVNGRDLIILESGNVNDILNDVLGVFDYYNSWEASAWAESAHKSFQRIIDLGDSVLGNPMMLSDINGKVLAMSSAFKEDDINEYWVEARVSNHVPTVILGSPMRTLNGEIASWTSEPREYVMPDGTKTIGAFLTIDGEAVAGIGLWEHVTPISPGDIWIMKILCNVLTSMINERNRDVPLRSSSAIIGDLLAGAEIDAELIEKLELKCKSPWQMLVIDNPFHTDTAYKLNILQRLHDLDIPCVPLIFGDCVVVVASQGSTRILLDSILGAREKQYYLAGLSLPFDNLLNVRIRYEQTLFALKQADEKPGVYNSEDYAFKYLLSLMGEKSKIQGLAHPALAKLRSYDANKQSEFFDTLYQYLLNERSILLGAEAMHVHRNSFMYRINRIKALLDIDLDDPMLRSYLLLSFLLE